MLRITSLSLLLGMALLVVGLALLSPTGPATGNKQLRLDLQQAAGSVFGTRASVANDTLQLPPSDGGMIRVVMPLPDKTNAGDFPFLHMSVIEPTSKHSLFLIWKDANEADTLHRYLVENRQRQSLWINTQELPEWQGNISEVGLLFVGPPGGAPFGVRDLSIHGASPQHWLNALQDDWLAYEPWDRAAMNSHTGVTQVSSFYPIPVSAALLALCVLAYLALVALGRGRIRFDWQVVGLLFLVCWLLVDAGWQHRLLRQLADTREQFAGLSSEEKLRVGPDAALISFVEQARQHLTPGARIFVTSPDDYKGLRTAYYFLPYNTYWKMQGGLPPRKRYRSGDFIAVIDAPDTHYRKADSVLVFPRSWPTPVDELVKHRSGKLYRVK